MNEFVIALSFIFSSFFLYLYLKNYSKYFAFRKNVLFAIILMFFATTIPLFNFKWLNDYIHLRVIFTSIAYFISFTLIYDTSIINSLFLTFNYILKNYCFFLIVAALVALRLNESLTLSLIDQPIYFHLTYVFSYALASLSIVSLDKLLLEPKSKELYRSKSLIALLITIQIVMLINLAILTNGESQPYKDNWYTITILLISLSIFTVYFLTRLFTANVSYLIKYKYHSSSLEKQLHNQLDHYYTYENQIQSFLKLKHDYEKTLNMISILTEKEDVSSIKRIVESYHKSVANSELNYQKYSNNLIVDALLNDYSKRFKLIDCSFSSLTHIPINSDLDDLNLIRLFSNIMDNMYEALLHIDDEIPKHASIITSFHDNYESLTFTNTTKESLNNLPIETTKSDKILHGFGIKIIDQIVESVGGFTTYQYLTINNITNFQLVLHFPKK